ncbi:MAG: terminase large subunit [Methanobrevibacter sp.]|jgi:phage terminase large subunit-like protein|nr:terminase large subunit [Methanobrevibacter sp.]
MKNEAQKIVEKYCRDIKSNKIPHCNYLKKAVNRFLTDIKREKEDSFDYFIDWSYVQDFYNFTKDLKLPDKEGYLKLLPWQLFIHSNLLGWKYKNNKDKKRFRSGAVFVPRKNGKTTGIMYPLLLWDFLTIPSSESYFFEKDGNQSIKMFNDIKYIINNNSNLDNVCNMLTYEITFNNSRISYFSSESVGIDGYKPSLAIIDEYFCFPSDKPVTAMRYGGRSRLNNLTLIITTAGSDISLPAYDEWEKVKKILNGVLTDESYFGIIYTIDDNDDWKKPESYIKANPSIDTIIDRNILEGDLQDALGQVSHQQDYKAKTLNVWTSGTSSWIPLQKWEDGQPSTINFDDFKEQSCYGALDLSSVSDFSAFSIVFEKEGKYYFKHKYYIPEETVNEKYKKENINILSWVQNNIITATPGNTVDYDYIIKDIEETVKQFNLYSIYYDNWQSNNLINLIEEMFPHILLVPFNQSLKNMSIPTKEFERLVYDKKIIDPNPVQKWMVSNAVVKPDINNNYKVLKEYKSSTKRVDGVICSIMALSACQSLKGNQPTGDFENILNLFK